MLECVPPRDQRGGRFAVGEPYADRWQFGGEFPDEEQHHIVYSCYFAVNRNDSDENGIYVCGYFTLKDYRSVTQEQLHAVTGGFKLGDQVQNIENKWQGRVTGAEEIDGIVMLVCHHVCGGKIEVDDKRWFDPRDMRLIKTA